MLISLSNRKYPPFPLLSYFSVVVCLRCLLHHILSLTAYTFRENREFVFIIIVQFMMSANIRIRFDLRIVLVCLYSTPSHYHHCANVSEGIELIKCLSDIFVECVSKINHILSVIHYTICGAVCFQFTHFPCDDRENIYTLSYYHHQIGSMNYYPLFRVRSWNNGVRCMSFYILIKIIRSWDSLIFITEFTILAGANCILRRHPGYRNVTTNHRKTKKHGRLYITLCCKHYAVSVQIFYVLNSFALSIIYRFFWLRCRRVSYSILWVRYLCLLQSRYHAKGHVINCRDTDIIFSE